MVNLYNIIHSPTIERVYLKNSLSKFNKYKFELRYQFKIQTVLPFGHKYDGHRCTDDTSKRGIIYVADISPGMIKKIMKFAQDPLPSI